FHIQHLPHSSQFFPYTTLFRSHIFQQSYEHQTFQNYEDFEFILINDLTPIERWALVEKHLISPHLAKKVQNAAALISKNEQVSVDRKSTRLNSSHVSISYAVFC